MAYTSPQASEESGKLHVFSSLLASLSRNCMQQGLARKPNRDTLAAITMGKTLDLMR